MSLCFNIQFSKFSVQKNFSASGDDEIRTRDPLLARQVLSQLSYAPIWSFSAFSRIKLPFLKVGLSGLEPPNSRLSGVLSNRLSYKPFLNLAGIVTNLSLRFSAWLR